MAPNYPNPLEFTTLGSPLPYFVRVGSIWSKENGKSDCMSLKIKRLFYFRDRKRAQVSGEGQRTEFSSRFLLNAEPVLRLDPTPMRSWPVTKPKVPCSTNWAAQAPLCVTFANWLKILLQLVILLHLISLSDLFLWRKPLLYLEDTQT